MFDLDYKEKLKKNIGNKRFEHSLRVCDMALKLNENLKINLDKNKVYLAALLHDCAKYNENIYLSKYQDIIDLPEDIINNKAVLHSFLGKIVAKKEYNINDEDILDAIKYHTTGRENMTQLEKIIFLADACEIKRDYEGVESIRKLAFKDLDKAMLESLNGNIKSLIDRNMVIFPLTIKARNYLIKEKDA